MNEEFSKRLSALRRERGLNQRSAAAALHISQALLSHYENGLREPGLDFVCTACRYYSVSSDYLLGLSAVKSTLSGEGVSSRSVSFADCLTRVGRELFRGLDDCDSDELVDTVCTAISVFLYQLMQPYEHGEEPVVPDRLVDMLCDAAVSLARARLYAAGDNLSFTIPQELKLLVKNELELIEDNWKSI